MKTAAVIMAGGAGTRLWPLSREEMPKQFHNLTGRGSLLTETVKRLNHLNPDLFLIATAKRYRDMSLTELRDLDVKGSVICEPYPKNTAAAVLYSAIYLSKLFDESKMIVLPADHFIQNTGIFIEVLQKGLKEADGNKLVTLGIKPSHPETGYGYIKAEGKDRDVLKVDKFVEKPDSERAKRYIQDGNYYWNGGIFIWKTSIILNLFSILMPELFRAFEPLMKFSAAELEEDNEFVWKLKEKIFSQIEPISIDYGILEKAKDRLVIPCDMGWTDLGSWNSIDDILSPDEMGNRTPAKDNIIFLDSKNCSVFNESKRIALIGVSDLVVVESGDSILVMDKSKNQDVKKVVDIIKKDKSP